MQRQSRYTVKTELTEQESVIGGHTWIKGHEAVAFTQFRADCKEDCEAAIDILNNMGNNILGIPVKIDSKEVAKGFEDPYIDDRRNISIDNS